MSTQAKQKAANKPAAEIRQGTLRIPIWEKTGKKGVFYTAGKPELSYNDNGEWKESGSYGEFDLECLALAALEARKKIRQLMKSDGPGDNED